MFNITQLKPKLIKIGILILLVLTAIWAIRYYSEDIVMFDHKEYKETSSNEQYKLYQSFYGPDIKLFSSKDLNVVDIEGEKYTIVPNLVTDTRKAYAVTFPNGRKFLVENIMGTNELITYDENLHPFVMSTSILSSGDKISQDGGILYYPSNFVVIAYEEYHEKQGEWLIFIIAISLLLFGYMLFINRKLQMVFFYLQHRLDVVDPEPSDFYFITTKIGAVVVMAVAVVIFFMSL